MNCESIVVSCDESIGTQATNCITDPNNIESLNALNEIQKLSSDHDLVVFCVTSLPQQPG